MGTAVEAPVEIMGSYLSPCVYAQNLMYIYLLLMNQIHMVMVWYVHHMWSKHKRLSVHISVRMPNTVAI
jgi:hypothetical protein